MADSNQKFIDGLQEALRRERATRRLYRALAERETNDSRRQALMALAETETGHAERWTKRLHELGAPVPPDRDSLRDKLWRWVMVQSGTDNALKRAESNEVDDTVLYSSLADMAPTEADRTSIQSVLHDEQVHGGAMQRAGSIPNPQGVGPQPTLDTILHRESWHRSGGGWIGQAIYGANDGLGSVFGIVSGVAGATAGGPAVLLAGLAGMLASALS